MISKGNELTDFVTFLNGGAVIDATQLDILVDNARTIIEEERAWVVLRKVDKSTTVTTASTYTTEIDLSGISDFSRFYSQQALKLFDGNNRIERYQLVPYDRQLEYKDVSNTACYDENAKKLYLNGTVPFNGTLYISYIATTGAIDLAATTAVWTEFPSRFLPLLGYYAIGIFKGAVDYDSINKLMLPTNQATLLLLKEAMEEWDNAKQQDSLVFNDPTEFGSGHRDGAIDRYND